MVASASPRSASEATIAFFASGAGRPSKPSELTSTSFSVCAEYAPASVASPSAGCTTVRIGSPYLTAKS